MTLRVEIGKNTMQKLVKEAKELASAIAVLLERTAIREDKPFYYILSNILRSLEIEPAPPGANVPIAATEGEKIYIGPLFSKISRYEQVFVILHEAMHVAYCHHLRAPLVGDPELYNIVADLYINTRLEKIFGHKTPPKFITLGNFHLKIQQYAPVSPQQVEALKQLAELVADGKATTEEVYNTILVLFSKDTSNIKKAFRKSAFFGKDLVGEARKPLPAPKEQNQQEEKEEDKRGRGGGKPSQTQESRREQSIGKEIILDKKTAEKYEKHMRKLARKAQEMIEKIRKALGEYQAMKQTINEKTEQTRGGHGIGIMKGFFGEEEYKQLVAFTINVRQELMGEVDEHVVETRTTFTEYDEDAYWLPRQEEIRMKSLLSFIDVSGSIPPLWKTIFTNIIHDTVKENNLKAMVSFFDVDEMKYIEITPETPEAKIRVPYGGGTMLGDTCAERIREYMEQGGRYIVILSDFLVSWSKRFDDTIKQFINSGGTVSCWSTTGLFARFCTEKHRLPSLSALKKAFHR